MARKTTLPDNFPTQDSLIGISSDEKIWKLAWEINRTLELDLEVAAPTGVLEGEAQNYEDRESSDEYEFFLLEYNAGKKRLPAIVKEFRFWLFLRPKKEKPLSVQTLINKIRSISGIRLAADISGKIDSNDYIA